jgi:hypothetical protein
MKKIIILALSILMVMAFTAPVLADVSGAVDFGGTGATYDLSSKVWIQYTTDTGGVNAQSFAIGTVHSAGDREYQTSDATSIIFWSTVAKGTTVVSFQGIGLTTGDYGTGWTAL